MKKRIIGLMLAIVTVLTLSAPFAVSANSEPPTTELGDIVSTSVEYFPEYGFTITEEMDVDNRIMLTLEREEEDIPRQEQDIDVFEEAAIILEALGFSQLTIDTLTEEQARNIAFDTQLEVKITYSTQDALGNDVYLTPDRAYDIAERENNSEFASECLLPPSPLQFIQQSGLITPLSTRVGERNINFGVMTIRHFINRDFNDHARLTFFTEARWLSMPSRRWADSVGSVASHISICHNTTMNLSFSYVRTFTSGNSSSSQQFTTRSLAISHISHDTFRGVAGRFDMPRDSINSCLWTGTFLNSTQHTNLVAVLNWTGFVSQPSVTRTFESIGSYYHNGSIFGTSTNASLSFGVSAGIPNTPLTVSASIGFSPTLGAAPTRRIVPLTVHRW